MKKLLLYSILLLTACLQACTEDPIGQTPSDGVAPAQLSDVQIVNIPGGATFTYQLPKDQDLLYVEAKYEMRGAQHNVKASCFENELTIEGYADTNEHQVSLYCVDRSNNYSEPIVVNITPKTTPVITIVKSMTMTGDIGGVHITWENEMRAPVNVLLFAADSLGIMQLTDVVYTSVVKGSHYIRGFDDTKRRFAAVVKDRWENYSDTVSGVFTPRYEKLIPKKDIKKIQMTDDNNENLGSQVWQFGQMFDDLTGDTNGWHTTNTWSGEYEHGPYFTIDLGHKVKLTRYKLWQRTGTFCYQHVNPKVWHLFTRKEDPTLVYKTHSIDDRAYWAQGFRTDAENWFHFMECRTEKPSGFDNPLVTVEDIEHASAGHEFIVDENAPAVRYIRFTIDQTWVGGIHPTVMHIAELEFYGKIVD